MMKNKKIDLMKMNLCLPDMIRKTQISGAQIKLIRLVRDSVWITSSKLAEVNKTTPQNTATQLKALWIKGYLERLDVGDGTGGTVYEYKINHELEGLKF